MDICGEVNTCHSLPTLRRIAVLVYNKPVDSQPKIIISFLTNEVKTSARNPGECLEVNNKYHSKIKYAIRAHEKYYPMVWYVLINNYSTNWRWLVVDIYRVANIYH